MNWSSLQAVSQGLILAGFIFTGVGGFGAWYFGKKTEDEKDRVAEKRETQLHAQIEGLVSQSKTLEEQLRPFRKLAEERFPTLHTEEALNELREEIQGIRKAAEVERNTLRSLATELEVTFSGTWTGLPYPRAILSPVDHQYYVEFLATEKPEGPIKFFATSPYEFETLTSGRAIFRSRQAVRSGAPPLGSIASALEPYRSIQIHMPFVIPENLIDRKITVEEVKLAFITNGVRGQTLQFAYGHDVPVQYSAQNKALAWANIVIFLRDSVGELIGAK